MNHDEQEIQALIRRWLDATKAGDTGTVLSLMTEDALFLTPGQPPMTKNAFAKASAAHGQSGAPEIDAASEVEEVKVLGEWAFLYGGSDAGAMKPTGWSLLLRLAASWHLQVEE